MFGKLSYEKLNQNKSKQRGVLKFILKINFCLLIILLHLLTSRTALSGDWAHTPMESLTPVVLSIEESMVAHTLKRFVNQIRDNLNIDLKIVTGPFEQQFLLQYRGLISGSGKHDILVHWPNYVPDYAPYIYRFKDIVPEGTDQVVRDLQIDDVYPAYRFCYYYHNDIVATQIDGDVKLLHYRFDLATNTDERRAFKDRYGYEFDMQNLTWDQYNDIAEFFTRPHKDFYGTGEIAGFFCYFTFIDRYVGSGRHLFSYEEIAPFPDREGTIRIIEESITAIQKYIPPTKRPYGFNDVKKDFYQGRIFMMPMWPEGWRDSNHPDHPRVAGKVAVALMPGFKRDGNVIHRPDMNGGRIAMINKASRHPVAAYKVLVFFSDKDRTRKLMSERSSWIDPWRKSHMDPAVYSNNFRNENMCKNYVEILKQSTTKGYPGLQITGAGKYLEIIERWISRAINGKTSAVKAYEGMVNEIELLTESIGRTRQKREWQFYVDSVLRPLHIYP